MKKSYIIATIVLLLVAGLIAWGVMWMHMPARGKVMPTPPISAGTTSLINKRLSGKYISFEYKGEYTAQTDKSENGSLERYTLGAGTQYSKEIHISVSELPDGKLEANGDYIYRQKSMDVYSSRNLNTGHGIYKIWVKKDGTEQTAMVPKGDKVAVISFVIGNGSNIDVTTEINALLQSLEWKK
jgi:hypothetical protein